MWGLGGKRTLESGVLQLVLEARFLDSWQSFYVNI
jgi:hypothetical protein